MRNTCLSCNSNISVVQTNPICICKGRSKSCEPTLFKRKVGKWAYKLMHFILLTQTPPMSVHSLSWFHRFEVKYFWLPLQSLFGCILEFTAGRWSKISVHGDVSLNLETVIITCFSSGEYGGCCISFEMPIQVQQLVQCRLSTGAVLCEFCKSSGTLVNFPRCFYTCSLRSKSAQDIVY